MSDGELLPRGDDALHELEAAEQLMHRGALDVCRGLALVKARELFTAAKCASFEEYCKHRLKYSRAMAYRLLAGAPIVAALQELSPIGEPVAPVKESHLRPVYGMQPQRAARVIAQVIEHAPRDRDGRPQITAKLVEAEARKVGFVPRREYLAKQRGEPVPTGPAAPTLTALLAVCRRLGAVDGDSAAALHGAALVDDPAFVAAKAFFDAALQRVAFRETPKKIYREVF